MSPSHEHKRRLISRKLVKRIDSSLPTGFLGTFTGSEREDAINMDAEQFKTKWAHLTMATPFHVLKQRGLNSNGTEEKK